MGLETGAAIALGGLLLSAAGTGVGVAQSRDAARDSKDARREQAYRAGQDSLKLQQAQDANDATAAARLARLRQKAILASNGGSDQTVATGPMGLSATQGAPTGPQPLKKLGA